MISKTRQEKFDLLFEKSLLSVTELEALKSYADKKIFSLHIELRSLLYLGILLFASGIGIIVYNNIDTIGHAVIIGVLNILCIALFYYSFKNNRPFSFDETKNSLPIYDYIVLLANILVGIIIGYLQFMYQVFGDIYFLPTLIPTVIYFASAYIFDHKGVLSMAITGLAATLGLSLKPKQLIYNHFYDNQHLIIASLLLSGLFILYTFYSKKISLKKHFNFTYQQFALHLFFLACLYGGATNYYFMYLLLIVCAFFYFVKTGIKEKYLSFIVFSYFYSYIFSIIFFVKIISESSIKSEFIITFFPLLYMIGTGFIISNLNRIRKSL